MIRAALGALTLFGVISTCAKTELGTVHGIDRGIDGTGIFEPVRCEVGISKGVCIVNSPIQIYRSPTSKYIILFLLGERAVKPLVFCGALVWCQMNTWRALDWEGRNQRLLSMNFNDIYGCPMDDLVCWRPAEILNSVSYGWLADTVNDRRGSKLAAIFESSPFLEDICPQLGSRCYELLASNPNESARNYCQES